MCLRLSPVLHTHFPDSLDLPLTSELHKHRCGLPSPTPIQKCAELTALTLATSRKAQPGQLMVSSPDHPRGSEWGQRDRVWVLGPHSQMKGVVSECHNLRGRPSVERGFHFLAGWLPTMTTDSARGADTRLGRKPGPVVGSLKKTHVSEELRIS